MSIHLSYVGNLGSRTFREVGVLNSNLDAGVQDDSDQCRWEAYASPYKRGS